MIDSDASLVARVVAADDRSAFELLVRRHQSPLRNFLRRLARNDMARADDLTQETLLKAYRAIRTYAGKAKFSTWLYSIAYNEFLNDQRKKFPETDLDEAEHALPLSHVDSAAIEWDVDRLLLQLPLRRRAVFDLHYKKGMTHQEIADSLEMPLGTVKADLTRGCETLKQYLVTGRS